MKIFIDKTEPIINNEITDRQTLLDVFLPSETFLQSVFLDVFNDETVEVQLCPLLDRFIQFDPGEKTPEDCPVSPAVEPPHEGGVDINDPAESHHLRAGLQPGMSQSCPG